MAFKFLPIVVAVFTIKFATAVAGAHNDCYNWDAKAPNGKINKDVYHECGVDEVKTFNNPKLFKCIVEAYELVNEDGTLKGEEMKSIIKQNSYPEYNDQLQALVDELLKEPPENFYTSYPKRLAKICPNDRYNRNP